MDEQIDKKIGERVDKMRRRLCSREIKTMKELFKKRIQRMPQKK
jgi:hypothetical protein